MRSPARLLLCAAFLWFAFAIPSRATVLVYKGIATIYTPTQQGYAASQGCYLILDLTSGEMTLLLYGVLSHKKLQSPFISGGALDDTPVSGAPNATYEIFSESSRTTNSTEYADIGAFFRGRETTVNIIGAAGSYTSASHPRSLVGVYRDVGTSILDSGYTEINISVVFDQPDTVDSNNSHLAISQVQTNIMGELYTKGYAY
jgi:hypothetical protein